MIIETSSNHPSFSFKKTCLLLISFISLLILFLGIPLLCIILILKPQMPDFSLQRLNIESYKLDLASNNLLVSSVFTLNLRADNPNKVGLSFESSKFHVLSQGLVVGLIRIPHFHQPPLSKNVSVETRVLFECVNVSEIMYMNSRKDGGDSGIRILGDIGARVKIFNITLPKIKVALDCDINVDQSKFSLSNEVYSMMRLNNNNLISIPVDSQTVYKKCSIAILL